MVVDHFETVAALDLALKIDVEAENTDQLAEHGDRHVGLLGGVVKTVLDAAGQVPGARRQSAFPLVGAKAAPRSGHHTDFTAHAWPKEKPGEPPAVGDRRLILEIKGDFLIGGQAPRVEHAAQRACRLMGLAGAQTGAGQYLGQCVTGPQDRRFRLADQRWWPSVGPRHRAHGHSPITLAGGGQRGVATVILSGCRHGAKGRAKRQKGHNQEQGPSAGGADGERGWHEDGPRI